MTAPWIVRFPFIELATNRHARVAFLMPGVSVRLHAHRPGTAALLGDSLGAQLRRRRRDLGLTRAEGAAALGVYEKTLRWWEEDVREPTVGMYPAVIRYLEREPWPAPATLSDRLLAERVGGAVYRSKRAPT